MPQAVPLPDGSYVSIREGETPQQAYARAQQMYPEAFKQPEPQAKPESGFFPATKAGIASLKGDVAALAGRTGLMDEAAAEKYIQEQEEYKKRTFKPTEEGWLQAPVTKTAELLGGSLPYMAAPVAAGLGALALPEAAAAAPILGGLLTAGEAAGMGAAGLTSAAQFTGSNLSRQMGEGKKLSETELGAAAAASIPQAALDILAFKLLPGIRGIFSAVGKEVPEKALLEATKQSTAQIAKDYALSTGKAMGVEGLTEAGQQVLERLQAGLSITDAKARDEYFDSFVGGAVLGGTLAPAGRYMERGSERANKKGADQEEFKKLRAEEEKRQEEEKVRLNSPEYAQEVLQKTQDLETQRKALKTQLLKVNKESPETDRAFNRDINRQIEAINKELKPLAEEYVRVKPILKQAAEKERIAKLTPQEYAFGIEPEETAQKTAEPELYEQQIAKPPEPPKVEDVAAQHAAQSIQLANDQQYASEKAPNEAVADYVKYLMRNPMLADQIVSKRMQLPGLPTGVRNSAVLDALKLQIAPGFKQEMETRKAAFGVTKPTEESPQVQAFTSYMDDLKDKRNDVGDDMFFKYMVDPKLEKIAEGKPEVVAVNPELKPIMQPKMAEFARNKINTLLDEIDQANTDRDVALRSNNRDAATAAFERGNQALEQINAFATETPSGELTKGKFPSAKTSPQASVYAREILRVRNEQNAALNAIEDKIDRLRRGEALGKEGVEPGKGVAAATPEVLAKQAEEARGKYISAVLEEAAIHRRAANKPSLTYDEAIKAASRIHDVVGEWLNRAQAVPVKPELEEVIVQPAQMRANKIVRGAITKRVLKTRDLATTPLNDIARLSDKEVKHFKAQIAKVVDSLSEMPSTAKREIPILKQQFASTEAQKVAEAKGETAKTLGGQLRRRTEFVRNLMSKPPLRPLVKSTRDALNRAADIMDSGKATTGLLDAVEHVATNLAEGRRVLPQDVQEINDAIKLYERTAQEGEAVGEGEKGQGQLFPETRKDLGYIRATPANFAKSPQIKPVWEALTQARKLKAKTEANQKARAARDKSGIAKIKELKDQIEAIKNNMKFFLTKSGDFNLGLYTNVDIAKMFVTYPEAGITKEDKALMDQYLAIVRNIFNQNYNPSLKQTEESNARLAKKIFDGLSSVYTPTQLEYVKDKLIPDFNTKIRPEYLIRLKEAQQAVALGERLENANNRLVEFMQDSNEAVRKQAEESRKLIDPLLDRIKFIKNTIKGSALLTAGERAALDSEEKLTKQRGAYKDAMAKAMGKARQRLSDTLGELLDPEIERARRALKAAKTRLATVESQIEAAKKEMTEGTGQAPNLINNLQKVQGLVENIEAAETELADLQEARFGEIENDVVVTEAMLDKDLKAEGEYLELLERQLATMRNEPLTAVELGERGKLGKLKYPFAAQRLEAQVKAQQAAVDAAQKRAEEFQKDVQVWWPKVTAAFKKDGISVKDLPGAVFEKGRKVAEISTPEQKRLDELRDKGMQAAKEVDENEVRQRVKDKQIQIFDDEIFDARGEVQSFMGPENMEQLADIMADPKATMVKRVQATLKLGAMQKLASLEAQKEVFLTGKPAKAPKAATVPSTAALAAAKPFRTGSGVTKAFTPAEMDEMDRAEIRDANALAKQILGTKAPQLKEPSKRKQGKILDPNMGLFDDFEFSRGTPVKGLTKAELEAELTAGMGEPVTGRKVEKQISDKLAVYESVQDFLDKQPKLKGVGKSKYEGLIPADAKGFVQDGKAVLFANNIGKGHGLGVLLHEVGVHLGFRNFFNEGQYNALIKTVKNWANKTDDSMEARVGKAAMRRVEAAATPENQIDDELLAYAVEEAMQMGVEPVGVKGGNAVKNWLKMVVDAFKKALEKFGITTSNLTAGDLVNFAYGAAHLELKGTWHGTGAKFDMFDHAYMSSGEGNQAFGWGTYRAQRYGTADYYQDIAHGAQLRKWLERPDIEAWRKSQAPKLIRKVPDIVPDWMIESAIDSAADSFNALSPNSKFKAAIERQIEDLEDLRSEPNMQDVGFGIQTDTQFKDTIEKLKAFAENAEEYVAAPHDKPLYKGKEWFAIYDSNEAAGKVLYDFNTAVQKGEQFSFNEAVEKVKADAKEDMAVFEGDPDYTKEYKRAEALYEAADKLDSKDFTYQPPSGPPVPEPVGYMLRTLHTRPENEYIHWDDPADNQPAVVKNVFKRIYDSLDATQKKNFDRSIGTSPPNRQNGQQLYEALSAVLEKGGMPSEFSDMFASEMLHAEGVAGIKFFDNRSRVQKEGTFNYVDFGDKEEGAQIIATNISPVNQTQPTQKGEILFSRAAEFTNPEIAKRGGFIKKIVAKDKSLWQRIKANLTGLAFETQLVDRFAGFERLAKYMEPLKGTQMLYYLRMYDQRMNFVSQAISNGAPAIVEKTRPDGRTERVLESKESANIHNVVQILKDAQPMVGNAEAVNSVFTLYMAALRAKNKGLSTLNFGEDVTQELLDDTMAAIKATPGLEDVLKLARDEYNAYNRNLVEFVVSTGALSKDVAKRLLSENDYIPFYRERNGVAELLIGGESPIRIGSIAEQPYLHELIGGDKPILDFMTSSVQNTNMLMDMGMRNLATKNAVFELVDLKAAKFVKIADGPDVVKFRDDGKDRYAVIATEKVKIGNKEFDTGVPADILVKGMKGIPTQMPTMLRVMAMPSQLLRKAITISPLYTAKQLFRDSLAAPILSGADFMPVIGALKELNSTTKKTLERRGVTGGQQFTGGAADLTKILRDVAEGKPGWMTALGKLEAMSMEADATTRRAQYNSYIEQGLSEMEATLLALESMNFNKRGASPSVHVANSLIPFFNAQIQGLNVLYKASMGKMPFNDQLRIREKLLQRGAMMAVASFAYAALMQDDDAYKNATPDQKYGNWFVRIPGLDEPVRVPVPFEIGYIFKALPEALYNSMVNEHGGEEAVKAFKQILLQTIPGGSSYGIPQALKPAIEAGLGKSFYTGRDILSAREKELLPEEQFRANTSELAKSVGKAFGISPIVFEQLVSGYTGTMGLAFMHALSVGIPTDETPEQAVKRLSEYPIIGGAFQPNDAGGIINSVYERMNENLKVKQSFDRMVAEGRMSEAKDLLQRRGNEYMQADLANKFKANMNKLTQAERAIAASSMTPEAKREQLDKIRKIKIAVAQTVREVSDKTIHLSIPF